MKIAEQKRLALETISEACDRYHVSKVFALFSGGDDSLAALRVAVEHPNFRAAVHCNTGVGVEATREFVHETCAQLGCPLIEYKATENVTAKGVPDPQIYERWVLRFGFPGPTKFGHGLMYTRLKERGIDRLIREHCKPKELVVLATGCREQESTRRMGTTTRIAQGEGPNKKNKRRIWVNHLFDWSKIDTLTMAAEHNLTRNPVAQLIRKSGECMCGAFGKEGELEELAAHSLTRKLGRYLLDLQQRVLAAGFPWKWHERVPEWWLRKRYG